MRPISPTAALRRTLALCCIAATAATSCSSSGSAEATLASTEPAGAATQSSGSASTEPAGTQTQGDTPKSAGDQTTLSTELEDEIRTYLSGWYDAVAPDRIVFTGVEQLGASACRVVRTHPSSERSPLPVVLLADDQIRIKEEHTVADVLQPCFYDVGLDLTASDAAIAAAAMSSQILKLEVSDALPPEVLVELGPEVADIPLDFENYAGPVIVNVDGVPTSIFIADDRVFSWYVVTTTLGTGNVATESIALIYFS